MSAPRPCPFCGEQAAFVRPLGRYVCQCCGCLGPSAKSSSAARALWNTRIRFVATPTSEGDGQP